MDVDSFFLRRTTTARLGKGAKVGVAIGAIAAVIVVVLAALMISVAVRESALLGAVETKTGSCPEYVWSAEDEYAPDDYPSIVTDDGSLRILQLTDIHFRNQGTFGGKKLMQGNGVKAGWQYMENSNTGGTVIDVAADGDLTIKLVQVSSVSAKVVEERTVAFGEE